MNNPTHNFDINWGGPGYNSYSGFMNTAATAVPNEAPPASAGSSADGSAPPAEGTRTGAAPTPPDANADNIRQLREGYEKFSKLGKYEDVAAAHQTFTTLHTEATDLAKKLNYDDADFKAAFAKDPVKTLQILRSEAAKANANPNQPPDVTKLLDQRLKPIEDKINEQQVKELEQKFDTTVTGLIDKEFGADAPAPLKNLVYDAVAMLLQQDEAELKAFRTEGKTAGIQKAFKEANEIVTRAFTSWQGHQQKRPGTTGTAGAAPAAGAKKPTLDEIINGTDSSGLIGSFKR